jgi:hypothetical protein
VAGVSATEIIVEDKTVDVGCSVTINITCVPSESVKAWEFKVRYDPRILSVTSLFKGSFFNGYDQFFRATINDSDGTIWNAYNLIVGRGNVSGAGTLLVINFTAIGIGDSSVGLFGLGVCNETKYIDCSFTNGSVSVRGPPANDTLPPQDNDTVPPVNDTVPPEDDDVVPPPEDDTKPPENNTVPPDAPPGRTSEKPSFDSPIGTFATLIVALFLIYCFIGIISKR